MLQPYEVTRLYVTFQVVTAANEKITVFCDITLCSLVGVDGHFRGCIVLMMEAVSTNETSVHLYETTRRCIIGGCHCLNKVTVTYFNVYEIFDSEGK
jgi:hypothetical protein